MSSSDDDESRSYISKYTNPDLFQTFANFLKNEEQEEVESSRVPKIPRRTIRRNHVEAAHRLFSHYFAPQPVFPTDYFRRRFRMPKDMFIRICRDIYNFNGVQPLPDHFQYFQLTPSDCVGRPGFNIFQKCTSAIRQLAYGCHGDQLDEYLEMAESISYLCLTNFCKCIIQLYNEQYLRRPTQQDVERIIARHLEVHGFPGMLGSIDCMHWGWRNYPVAWQGHYTRGDKGHPTFMLEVAASYDLWLWHAYFGLAGSNNDINVLNESDLFDQLLENKAPQLDFTVNGEQFTKVF
uniref:uncharacterized protein LOC122591912 n=1 Tax=Erigeron canadensis TaxID=72917 RepID=UPI001CB9C380|nr:uncharacterized protein LOC122591912 [Erigeron canadensis]